MNMDSRTERITKLLATLNPSHLRVINDSAKHADHAATRGLTGTETHYTIEITTTAFANKTTVERHRIINNLLKNEFANGLHALHIKAKTP